MLWPANLLHCILQFTLETPSTFHGLEFFEFTNQQRYKRDFRLWMVSETDWHKYKYNILKRRASLQLKQLKTLFNVFSAVSPNEKNLKKLWKSNGNSDWKTNIQRICCCALPLYPLKDCRGRGLRQKTGILQKKFTKKLIDRTVHHVFCNNTHEKNWKSGTNHS